MNEEVRRIMSPNPPTINPEQSVIDVSYLMLEKNFQQLPVVDEGKFIGLVTSHDLWKKYENNPTLKHLKVKDVMNTHVIKLSPKDKVGTAAELFADKRFKTLPVVNLRNELKGVVTAFDLIKVAFNAEYENPILYKEAFKATI